MSPIQYVDLGTGPTVSAVSPVCEARTDQLPKVLAHWAANAASYGIE